MAIHLDNADDPDMDLGSYFPSGNKVAILITTRNTELSMLATVRSLEIGRLSLRDTSKLRLKASKNADRGIEKSINLAVKIVRLPLARNCTSSFSSLAGKKMTRIR